MGYFFFMYIPEVVVVVVSMVTGRSLVSIMLVEAIEELRNLEVIRLCMSFSCTTAKSREIGSGFN